MTPSAKIIADSISPDGARLTTFEVKMHRFVLAEFNTHRVFSRCSASSRAIPVKKRLHEAEHETALPVAWPAEQSGMQGGEELSDEMVETMQWIWKSAAVNAVLSAHRLSNLGLHKSVTNRLLEPFLMHTVVVTATAWENWFALRSNALAQPEIKAVSDLMKEAYDASTPVPLDEFGWHVPYMPAEDIQEILRAEGHKEAFPIIAKVSAARCARVSYLTHDGARDYKKDLELFERLSSADPMHASPLEHVATPWARNRQDMDLSFTDSSGEHQSLQTYHLPRVGNLLGWRSLRTEIEAAKKQETYR